MRQREVPVSGILSWDAAAAWTAKAWRRLALEQGSSLVEFALVVVIFMSMVLGIMDFGRALYSYHFVSHAAREATRYAAVRGSTCTLDGSCTNDGSCATVATLTCLPTYVTNNAPPGIDTTKITTTPNWPVQANGPAVCKNKKNAPGCTVEVQVSYSFSFLFPLVHTGAVTLSSTSEMVIAH
jgi:Flp pilus assembly protein TadG